MRKRLAFCLLVVLWALVITIFLTPEPRNSGGFPHPTYATMDQGGDGTERHDPVLVLGWLFGSAVIALLVGLLWFGAGRRHGGRAMTWVFIAGGLLFEGVFAMMCLAYRDSLASGEPGFSGPFPTATSWLMFGIWLFPFYFVGLYVLVFDGWFMRREDLDAFDRLLEEAGRKDAGAS